LRIEMIPLRKITTYFLRIFNHRTSQPFDIFNDGQLLLFTTNQTVAKFQLVHWQEA
jgi:hypothetical protein